MNVVVLIRKLAFLFLSSNASLLILPQPLQRTPIVLAEAARGLHPPLLMGQSPGYPSSHTSPRSCRVTSCPICTCPRDIEKYSP